MRVRRSKFKFATFIAGFSMSVSAFASATPNGEWARDDGSVRTRIARCGTKVCAITLWAKNPNSVEKAGDRFIMSLTASDPGHWTGSAFDPQRNLRYTVDLRIEGDRLTTRGCIVGSNACLNADWLRVRK
jgi:uncharacterized protein (DUF2147 family)